VGAPWGKDQRWLGRLTVGNSGLCLRQTHTMLAIVEKYHVPSFIKQYPQGAFKHNDIFFSEVCYRSNYNVPSMKVAQQFSVETVFYPDPCGMHKPFLSIFPKDEFARMLSKKVVNTDSGGKV
jgi:hypothetical protein